MSDINSLDRRRMALYGWMLLAPALILLATFAFLPTVATLWQSVFSRGTSRRPRSSSGSAITSACSTIRCSGRSPSTT
jgi:sn-glycerol 3-phosphate transport system permease protein